MRTTTTTATARRTWIWAALLTAAVAASPWSARGVTAARADGDEPAAGEEPGGGDGPPAGDAGVCGDGPAERAAKLDGEVADLFAAKKYDEAAAKCREQIKLVPGLVAAHYNLACALARTGKTDEALAELRKAADLGFDDADHVKADDDLASLRDAKGFDEIVKTCATNEGKAAAGTYDPGVEMPALRSVDGAPEGGLRWRLLLAKDASAEKPQRLLVWLHPSGGSMNARICQLALKWTDDGFAVLLPTQKGWKGWTDAEARKLLDVTIPDAAKTPGVDARRPVLAGFSAGGQAALNLWQADPSRFGGLFVDAAYPIDTAAYQQGRIEPVALPEGDATKGTPILVLVGDADGGHKVWKQVEEPWRAAGLPLTVEYVPGGKHAWLVDPERQPKVDAWLRDVAAGKLPGAAAAPAK